MRLHRLRLSAFGPFPGEVDIDVDAVAETGLFLIRGATGAGKTSLLDAICFALYADVPGARSKKGLHSAHATAGQVPRVDLEFTAAGRRFRIERSPEFVRPSKRAGGKPVTVPARAALFERAALGWRELSARHDEIADTLRLVLGMGLEQFSKVVLLPQGDFAAFLRATPEERRGLLERLFDIATFAGIEEWLAERRRESGAALAALQTALEAQVARIADVLADLPAGEVPAAPALLDLETAQLTAQLARVRQALDAHAVQALAELDAATSVERAAVAAHVQGRQVLALQQKGASARERLGLLDAGREAHEQAVDAIEQATRAAAVRGELRALARAEAATRETAKAVQIARAEVARYGLDDHDGKTGTAWADLLSAHDGRLAEAKRCAAAGVSRQCRIRQVQEGLDHQRQAQGEAADHLVAAQRQLTTAHDRLAASSAAATRLPAEVAEVARLSELYRIRREQEHGAAKHAAAREERSAARTAEQDARQRVLDLREARLAGMAGELAGALQSGEACPVCGSCEHPLPAERLDPVTPEDLAEAEQAWAEAGQWLGDVDARIAALESAAEERRRALGEEQRTTDELEASVSEMRARQAATRALASQVTRHREDVAAAQSVVDTATAHLGAVREAMVTAQTTLDELCAASAAEHENIVTALRAHAATCPCVADAPEALSAEIDAATDASGLSADVLAEEVRRVARIHQRAASAVDGYREAIGRHAVAAAEQRVAATATQEALAEHGFASGDQAQASLLPSETLAELRRQTAEYQRVLTTAEAVLTDPDVVAAQQQPTPDLVALSEAETQARQRLMAAKDRETLARRTVRGLGRLALGLDELCQALPPAKAEHAVLVELADAAAGTGASNTRRMRLSAFVLAARLEKVAELANERLATMGDGRYRLRHTDGLAGRGARSGLGLEVEDLWTGQTRDTSSLSGGESFMASLALALGLADAVREESGGFHLQTLFVDEGFGTLDDESLEQVMDVLDGLREGGRAVGVVSHVAELRTRIPSQVVVHKTERGSTVQVTAGQPSAPAA